MVEFCKNIAINMFWVLAAVAEILFVTGVILTFLSRIRENREEDHEETD